MSDRRGLVGWIGLLYIEYGGRIVYAIRVIDRKTKEVVQEEIRKSEKAAERIWCLALKNVNRLKYKLQFEELKNDV